MKLARALQTEKIVETFGIGVGIESRPDQTQRLPERAEIVLDKSQDGRRQTL